MSYLTAWLTVAAAAAGGGGGGEVVLTDAIGINVMAIATVMKCHARRSATNREAAVPAT